MYRAAGIAGKLRQFKAAGFIAFSSEVDTGSRKENASKRGSKPELC
jgi:hypothetical protein